MEVSHFNKNYFFSEIIKIAIKKERQDRFYFFMKNDKRLKKWSLKLYHFESYLNLTSATNISELHDFVDFIKFFNITNTDEAFCISSLTKYQLGITSSALNIFTDIWRSGGGALVLLRKKSNLVFYFGEDKFSSYVWSAQ